MARYNLNRHPLWKKIIQLSNEARHLAQSKWNSEAQLGPGNREL